MSFLTLKSNLQEIYCAHHSKKDLVPNIQGTKVYVSSRGWGRVWRVFFTLFFFLDKNKKLEQAIKKTHAVFQKKLKEIKTSVDNYNEYLREKCTRIKVCEKTASAARKKIYRFNEATRTFVKLVRKNDPRLNAFFQKYLPEKDPFVHPSCEPDRLYKMIEFESLLQEGLDFDLLKDLAIKGKKVDESEPRIKKLVQKINRQKLPVRWLHKFLYHFVERLEASYREKWLDLSLLEYGLHTRGLECFEEEDKKHIEWRDSLKKGDRVDRYLLGEPFAKKPNGKDRHVLFHIENDPDHLMIFGVNESAINIKKQRINNEIGCIDPADIVYLDPKGRFGIVEKLQTKINSYAWKSQEKIHPDDAPMINALINLIKEFMLYNDGPKNLSTDSLFFKDGLIKTSKTCEIGPFDYKSIEELVFTLSSNNRKVFSCIMEKSGLLKHKVAIYFSRVVTDTLHKRTVDTSLQAAIRKITDKKIIERADKLLLDVASLKNLCIKKLNESFLIKDEKKLDRRVRHAILKAYKRTNSAGILCPSLENEVVQEVAKKEKLITK